MDIYEIALLSLSFSAFISFAATPLVIRLAHYLKIIDDPKGKTHAKVIHTYPVPRGGGLAIFISVLITSLAFLPLDKHLKGILTGALIITIVGILDDRYDLNPYLRMAFQFLAAGMPIIAGIGISFISNPFNGIVDLSYPRIEFNFLGEARSIWVLSDTLALFWVVTLMNFINMGAKGVDGQLPGVVAIAAMVVSIFSLGHSADITQWPVITLSAITAGAFLGFLPWNFYPQKIMPSFSGSNLGGYLLGVVSILATAKLGLVFVVLGLPLIDTTYTVVRRIASGKSPVWGDVGHLHHKLLDFGFSKRQVAYFYWGSTALLGALALSAKQIFKLYIIAGIIVFVGGLLLWLTQASQNKEK
jgi:UDP-GlcNAc:undecaprenyl-phosphate GlcNAc-1-phosphate transferase